ncbi:MAG TPA: tetratricopeptide repeat protein [Roseiflexaceae bacterium]|nr:tetratricopeptide repeat protein [Roseiflexaceae bacterium]
MSEQPTVDGPTLLRSLLEREQQTLEWLGLRLEQEAQAPASLTRKSRHHLTGYVLAVAQLLVLDVATTDKLLAAYGQPLLDVLRRRGDQLLKDLLSPWFADTAQASGTNEPVAEHLVSLVELARRMLTRLDAGITLNKVRDIIPPPQTARLHMLLRALRLADDISAKTTYTVRIRHARHYIKLVAKAEQQYRDGGEGMAAGLKIFDQERANLDSARVWVQEQTSLAPQTELDELLLADADATANLGDLRYSKTEQRIPQLERALAAARHLRRRSVQGNLLGNLGLSYRALGQPRRAVVFFEQCLAIAREIDDRRGESNALGNLGLAYLTLGETRRAIVFFEQDLAIVREIDDRYSEGKTLGNLGTAYLRLSKFSEAISFFEQDLAIARELRDRQGEGAALGNLGTVYLALGKPYQAIPFLEQNLTIARELNDVQSEGAAIGNLGNAYLILSEYHRAIPFLEQHINISIKLGDIQGKISAMGNLGIAYLAIDKIDDAITFFKQHLSISKEIGDLYGESIAIGNIGSAFMRMKKPHDAIPLFKQHLAISRKIGNIYGKFKSIGNLGNAYLAIGDIHRAISFFKQQITISRDIYDINDNESALINLGNAYLILGDTQRAITFYNQYLSIARHDEDQKNVSEINWNIGIAFAREHDITRALRYLEQSLLFYQQTNNPRVASMIETVLHIQTHGTLPPDQNDPVLPSERTLPTITSTSAEEIQQQNLSPIASTSIEDSNPAALDEVIGYYLPLLGDIALAAHGDTNAQALAMAFLPLVEQNGWHIKQAIQQLWAGERDADVLTVGLDAQDTALIQRALTLVAEGPDMIFVAQSLQIAHLRYEADTVTTQTLRTNDTPTCTTLAQQLTELAQQVEQHPGAPWQDLAAHLRALAAQLTSA